ncbi:MAG TPA: hypothetical protein VNJ12_09255 [Candidatus Dormibacteraeota bacterium]|nr:hypothetical protein [Candidatus Dormibacteraeota bacterium]
MAGVVALLAVSSAWAQQGVLSPAQSAAKAKRIIQQTIQALGGQKYLDVREQTCDGQAAFFGHHDQISGYEKVYDYNIFPDKERTEYSSKRDIIDVYNGKQGWTLDHGGVSDISATKISDFQAGTRRDINNLFRFWLKEPGIQYQYDGPDVVDLKQVDWVEVTDPQQRTTKIAVAQLTNLPVRAIYVSRDPATHERTEETEYFSNYQMVDGIETPFQDTRTRNGQKLFQFFVSKCQYNTPLEAGFFTRQSLEERWAKLGGNKKKKKKKHHD